MNARSLPTWLACLLASVPPVVAQLAPVPQFPGIPRPAGQAAGLTPEIEAFLKSVVRTYATATGYRDRGRVRLVQRSGRVKTTTETPMELSFERPNRLRLDAGQFMIFCDGRSLLTVAPHLAQFTEAPAPAQIERKHLVAGSVLGSAEEGHPELIDFFLQPEADRRLLAQIASIGWLADAEVAGARCRVLAYETAQRTKITAFIDAERLVLLQVDAGTLPDPAAGVAAAAIELSYEFWPVELNPAIEPATFAFQPDPSFKRVNQLGPTTPNEPAPGPAGGTPPILGKVAPPVEGKDLGGMVLTAADVRGRTLFLFFWSLGGGQYCLNSIPIVQQIAERFADRPGVLVLGINADPESATTVAQLLERKKATFRTVLDEEMRMHRAFELAGVPTFVVIGADGVVQWAQLGAPPTLQDDAISAIEKALGQRVK